MPEKQRILIVDTDKKVTSQITEALMKEIRTLVISFVLT